MKVIKFIYGTIYKYRWYPLIPYNALITWVLKIKKIEADGLKYWLIPSYFYFINFWYKRCQLDNFSELEKMIAVKHTIFWIGIINLIIFYSSQNIGNLLISMSSFGYLLFLRYSI